MDLLDTPTLMLIQNPLQVDPQFFLLTQAVLCHVQASVAQSTQEAVQVYTGDLHTINIQQEG